MPAYNAGGYGTTPQDAADAAEFGIQPPPPTESRIYPSTHATAAPFVLPQWLMIAAAALAIWYFMRKK
jgi:hypothetical protein